MKPRHSTTNLPLPTGRRMMIALACIMLIGTAARAAEQPAQDGPANGQPATEPAAQPATEPATAPAAQPVAQPVAQPAAEPVAQPAAQPDAQAVAQPVAQPIARAVPTTGSIGLGALFGDPTGITVKGWLNDKAAIDGAVAWSFDDDDSLQLHADYLYHKFDLFPVAQGRLPLYFGVGGRVLFDDRRNRDDRFGIRGPIGLAYLFDKAPVEIFLEVAPILDLAPSTKFDINGGIGVRFYFK